MESTKKIKKGQIEDFISDATQTALDLKLDKSSTPSSVYTTDEDGLQVMKPLSEFGGGGSGSYTVIGKNVVDSAPVTGTTATTTVETFTIPANTFEVGDIIVFRARIIKTGTAGVVSHRYRINAQNIAFFQTSAGTNLFSEIERRLIVKASNKTQDVTSSTSLLTSNIQTGNFADLNIDWTINQDLELRFNLGNASDSAVVSYWELSRIR
jgi:hypothetical protein